MLIISEKPPSSYTQPYCLLSAHDFAYRCIRTSIFCFDRYNNCNHTLRTIINNKMFDTVTFQKLSELLALKEYN